MSQISNGRKIHYSKYTYLLNLMTYEYQLKLILAKRNNFPNFEIFKKVFGLSYELDEYASLEPP